MSVTTRNGHFPFSDLGSRKLSIVFKGGPLYVIVEYCEHGNLRDFLRQHDSRNEGYERPNSERLIISERTLVSFARQVRNDFV